MGILCGNAVFTNVEPATKTHIAPEITTDEKMPTDRKNRRSNSSNLPPTYTTFSAALTSLTPKTIRARSSPFTMEPYA